jgi:tRNA(Ile)-lysidine synthase
MVDKMVKSIESLHLFAEGDLLLVGASGGIDSVVMVDLLHRAGLAFGIAHCNFKLRGEDSDLDEKFVRTLASSYDKPFFCKKFETLEFARENGISVEMAARELRYNWFEEIRHQSHFDWILVAHHKDDQAETFFLNLVRGTGIGGLTGMKVVQGKVVRPMLFAFRKDIEQYASENQLEYREDKSNSQTEFHRNKIRHLILPLLEEINPSFRKGLIESMQHFQDAYSIYNQSIEYAKELVVRRKSNGDMEILLAELKLLTPMSTYLFEMLKPCHFSGDVVTEIVKSIDGQSGKQFFSSTHRAVLDREVLLVQKLNETNEARFYLEEGVNGMDYPLRLSVKVQQFESGFKIGNSSRVAYLDRDKIQFPLILRKWQSGDFFQPLGMLGMKKLSDFFVDEKFSLPKKEQTWLLANGEEIVWIVGIRLDDRYKIMPGTRNILVIELD